MCDPAHGDRGERAALRKYWSETTKGFSYPPLGKLNAIGNTPKSIIAALYAEHPANRRGINIGSAARALGVSSDGEHPYERHFRRLLACDDIYELGWQLHRLVKRLARTPGGPIALDYQQLLIDLYIWCKTSEPQKRERLKVRWAASFWNASLPETEGMVKEATL